MLNSRKYPVLRQILLVHHFIPSWPHQSLIVLCGFCSVACSVQSEGLGSPQCLSLFIPAFSADTEAGIPTTHLVFMHAQSQSAGELTFCGRNLGPWWLGANGQMHSLFFPLTIGSVPYFIQLLRLSVEFGNQSPEQRPAPLPTDQFPHLLCFAHLASPPTPWLPTPSPNPQSPVKHLHLSFCFRFCFLGNVSEEGAH